MGSLKDKEDIADILKDPPQPSVNTMFFWLKGKVITFMKIHCHVNKRGNYAKTSRYGEQFYVTFRARHVILESQWK